MPAYEELQNRKNELIRKALSGGLFLAPMSVDPLEKLTGEGGSLAEFVTNDQNGYTDGGWMTDDGMQLSRDVDSSDITSFGSVEPTRSDINSDVHSCQVSFQETNRLTISLITGVDYATLAPDTNGELQVTKPTRPKSTYWRLLALGVDDGDAGEIYIGVNMPRAKVTEYDDQALANGDDAIAWAATFQAQKDTAAGFAVRYMFGGPGWAALLEDMGFAAAEQPGE